MRMSWLYFAVRSLRARLPVLIDLNVWSDDGIMNTLHCQNLQARLLEMKAGGLSEAERVHLGQCPACREFAQDVSAPGAALTAVAQQLQRQSPITLPAGLKNSVLQKMSPKLAAEERAAAPTPQAAEAGRNTPQRERDWSELLGTVLGQWRWRWAAACAALACIAIDPLKQREFPVHGKEAVAILRDRLRIEVHIRHMQHLLQSKFRSVVGVGLDGANAHPMASGV